MGNPITDVLFGAGEQGKKIRGRILAVAGGYLVYKLVKYLRWKGQVNRAIKGPDSDWESAKELYKADLGDFWGFNATLLTNLHNKYGKVVKLWLGGQLYISFNDCNDIDEINKKAKGRPPLVQNLLPFLGKKNLLFQPTAHDDGRFVKALRLKYGSMVQGEQGENKPLRDIHRVTIKTMENRTKHWGDGAPINIFEELKHILYDIMGEVLFGGAWSANENGALIIKTHRMLIEGSATLGLSCCDKPTIVNFMKIPGDYMRYQNAIKEFHEVCWRMIEQRRKEVAENPSKWAADHTALTMLVTTKGDDGKPFFDKVLAISTCAGFLNGAYDTTHITTFWLMYHLATNMEEQEKLIAEIDAAFPNKAVPVYETCNDVTKMKRLQACLQESIRRRPTVPLGMRGNYRDDTQIGKTTVPKGATIMPFTAGAHRDPEYFGADVDKFRPDRFMGDSPEAKKAIKAFHGFGSGYRMCVGFKFAETELKALFCYFLQRYTVHLADPNMPVPEMVFESGCQAPKAKFSYVFKPRKSDGVQTSSSGQWAGA